MWEEERRERLKPVDQEPTTPWKAHALRTFTMSMLLAMAGPQGWAELPEEILQSIIGLLSCTHDLLAFIATCPSWREAFMKAKPSLSKLFPPLMVRSCALLSNDTAHSEVHHTWQLTDPANPSLRFHRPAPTTIPSGMTFVGCSYGQAIFADLSLSSTGGRITMVDVFTGVQVSPPPCPVLVEAALFNFIDLLCCALTAPISSPKARLLVSSTGIGGSLLVWRVGAERWRCTTTDHPGIGPIDQIVVFKDKIIALDKDLSLFTVHLDLDESELSANQKNIRALLIVGDDGDHHHHDDDEEELFTNARLVVCGDRLAMVASDWDGGLVFFHLELEPAPRWSPVPELDCAVFISGAYGDQLFFEGRYGRWAVSRPDGVRGGRGGDVIFAGHGNELYPFASGRLLPSWVTPSVLELEG